MAAPLNALLQTLPADKKKSVIVQMAAMVNRICSRVLLTVTLYDVHFGMGMGAFYALSLATIGFVKYRSNQEQAIAKEEKEKRELARQRPPPKKTLAELEKEKRHPLINEALTKILPQFGLNGVPPLPNVVLYRATLLTTTSSPRQTCAGAQM